VSAATSSCCYSTSSGAGQCRQAGSSTSPALSTNAAPDHFHRQKLFIESFACTIRKVEKDIPQLRTMSVLIFRGADVTKFIKGYESLPSLSEIDPAAEDVIATYLNYGSEMMHELHNHTMDIEGSSGSS